MHTCSLEIRTAGAADAPLIADISRSTFYDTFASANTAEDMAIFMNEQFTKEALENEVLLPSNIFLLAYSDARPAGYVKLRHEVPKGLAEMAVLEIARIYVVKEFIGHGVGKRLMEHVVDLAKKMNKEGLWLGVWEKNYRAVEFYERCGFTKFDQQVFVLGRDVQKDWLMFKKF